MADHTHGKMDITEQEKMFAATMRFSVRTVVVIFVVLIFLALVNA